MEEVLFDRNPEPLYVTSKLRSYDENSMIMCLPYLLRFSD